MSDTTKRCGKCKSDKPVDQFGRNAWQKDGLQSWCKECANRTSREWTAKRPKSSDAPTYPAVKFYRAQVAAYARSGHGTEEDLLEARRNLAAAKIAHCIGQAYAEGPPLTTDQRERLVRLIQGVES